MDKGGTGGLQIVWANDRTTVFKAVFVYLVFRMCAISFELSVSQPWCT